jgi:uncharacterized protein (TIGR03067 family)
MTWLQTQQMLAIVLAAGVALVWPVPSSFAADQAERTSELNGTWKLVSVEVNGEAREVDDELRWVIQGEEVSFGGEPLANVAVYAASTPKGIDVAFHEPKTVYEGIYVLEKDDLKICLNTRTTGPKERPFDFATKEKTNLRMLNFQRLAAGDAGPGLVRGYVGVALGIENEVVVIQDVLSKSPAEKAGLRSGDRLLSVGNDEVKDLQLTVEVIRRCSPGSDVTIRVLRESQEKAITVRVAAFPFSLFGLLG